MATASRLTRDGQPLGSSPESAQAEAGEDSASTAGERSASVWRCCVPLDMSRCLEEFDHSWSAPMTDARATLRGRRKAVFTGRMAGGQAGPDADRDGRVT